MEAEAGLTALPRAFFERDTVAVARDLLGAWLLRRTSEGIAGGPIVETEAYRGPEDLASHARAGRTRRTAPMFGTVGHAYVYLVYGMHHCLNVVAHTPPAQAGAVLIRAIEPRLGLGAPGEVDARLCAGPAKVCRALDVTRTLDGHDLTAGERLWLAAGQPVAAPGEIASGPRIGVKYAGPDWSARPWRFWLAASPSVSR